MIKYYFIWLMRLLTKIFYILPIKKNRILFYSFSGKEYSDSPKYIADYITENTNEFEIIWAVNEPEKWKSLESKGWKVIGYKSFAHLIYGLTSRFIITNTGPYAALDYRKEQIIINTWHGGGAYKKTGVDNPYKDKWKVLYNKNYGQSGVKLFLSSSEAFMKYAIRGAFEYQGEVLKCGLPRNDVLLDTVKHKEIVSKVKQKLQIKKDERFILYAPTWRNYETDSYEKIDVPDLIKACEERFGGNWKFVYRGHNLSKGINVGNDNSTINATGYPDMQELMIASSVLISDYSSCVWDYSLMYKPCFLFTPDLDKYDSTFAFYEPIETWGFEVCRTNKTLLDSVKKFEDEVYKQKVNENHRYFGMTETGEARKAVYEYICALTGKEKYGSK